MENLLNKMSQSTLISIVLAVLIITIFLIDYLKKRKEDSLEKSVEKFVEKESGEKSWYKTNKLFWLLPASWIILYFFFVVSENVAEENNKEYLNLFIGNVFEFSTYVFPVLFFFRVFFYFGINWVLKRKKNIAMFIFALIILKVMLHFFIYPEIEIYTPKKYSTW